MSTSDVTPRSLYNQWHGAVSEHQPGTGTACEVLSIFLTLPDILNMTISELGQQLGTSPSDSFCADPGAARLRQAEVPLQVQGPGRKGAAGGAIQC